MLPFQELLRRLGVPLDQRVEAGSGIPEQAERLLIAARVVALQEVRSLAFPETKLAPSQCCMCISGLLE